MKNRSWLLVLILLISLTGRSQVFFVKEVSLFETMDKQSRRDSIDCKIILTGSQLSIIRDSDTGVFKFIQKLERRVLERGAYYEGNIAVLDKSKYMILFERASTGSLIAVSVSNYISMVIFLIYTKPELEL